MAHPRVCAWCRAHGIECILSNPPTLTLTRGLAHPRVPLVYALGDDAQPPTLADTLTLTLYPGPTL